MKWFICTNMKTIIIFYPYEFNVYSKFKRKVSRILNNLDAYNVVFTADDRGFIKKFFSEIEQEVKVEVAAVLSLGDTEVNHAIVFDDGASFPDLISELQDKQITYRLVKIPITRVINIKKQPTYQGVKQTANYEYIGRGSYWGNPYSMHEAGDDRDEVIRKYKYDFDNDKFPNKKKADVLMLTGKKLGCFCKPAVCHGDVLADYLNSLDDKK